jgi:hypothetical protein
LASLKSNVDALAKSALVLETSTDEKRLIKLGPLITIDDIREEMMKNHGMLEADDKERLPVHSKNANKGRRNRSSTWLRFGKQSLGGKYMPGRLEFSLSWTMHASRIALLPSYSYHFIGQQKRSESRGRA